MSKVGTAARLLKLAANQPSSIFKAAKYGLKYGLLGLRDKFHEELVLNDITIPEDAHAPSTVDGDLLFSVIMPVYNVDIRWLEIAIESIEKQSYRNWELCIADDASTDAKIRDYLLSKRSDKIKVLLLEENRGISEASNAAASLASGDYMVLMDNDDVISGNALEELFTCATVSHADILYSDNDVIDEEGSRLAVLHKPDWSPDLFLSQMYVGHLLSFRRSLFRRVGGFRTEFNGSQDYDLLLRMTAHTQAIQHIAKVLYSWRALDSSTSANPDSKPYAQIAGKLAVQDYLDNVYGQGVCRVDETDNLFVYDVRYPVSEDIFASIIIPTKDHVKDLQSAISSIFEMTDFPSFEIIVLDNNSTEQETLRYFEEVQQKYTNVRVVTAHYQFNWSKLNNQGMHEAKGDVFVFLNNDVTVMRRDWLTRLVENAVRPDIGAVGGLLLYPDGTIQHAGVVIGMGGWADHVYKGMQPLHNGNPYISPMVSRNVSAVTGACMALSRATIEKIGEFDEEFIVCGSDVEICLRARKYGLRNLYDAQVRLKHYESKTRDANAIPEVDFRLSEAMYRPYLASGDPYYNRNLDYMSCTPRVISRKERMKREARDDMWVGIAAIRPLHFVASTKDARPRLNLLVPSVNPKDIFGGISTALNFFERIVSDTGIRARIVVLDSVPKAAAVEERFPDYVLTSLGKECDAEKQIVSACRRSHRSLPVSTGDWFIATSWWSAYCFQDEALRQRDLESGMTLNPLIYLIQDYEPGFYAWSSEYLLAKSTYQSDVPTIAVFNSNELKEHFASHSYTFQKMYVFEPFLNKALATKLREHSGVVTKRKQILVYGRPGTPRNAFELVVESLRRWIDTDPIAMQWDFLSAGEQHPPVPLSNGRYLSSVGKLSLDDYAALLSESYAGISLMVSPHPSYPPLEMAAFGVQVISNQYDEKDLSTFSPNITSLKRATPHEVAAALHDVCSQYRNVVECENVRGGYLDCEDPYPFIAELEELIAK